MSKIIMFIDSLGAGGAQRQFVGLATLLKKEGYDVQVLTYFDLPFYNYVLDENGVPYKVVKGADSYFKRIPLIKQEIEKVSPDVIIAYQETPSIIACIIKKMSAATWKLIVSERNTSQVNNWREKLRFNIFRIADYIVPNSYSQENFINTNYKCLKQKVVTISNFVDTEFFLPKIKKVNNSNVEIIVAASIWKSKNTLGLIKAVDLLKEKTTNFHIKWYGKTEKNIDYYNEAVDLIKKLNLEKYIELLDKTNVIVEKYNESDLFCLPSFYEGTPNVICEAMSCGLPIVCSDVCDNGIYVKNGVNGWLFDPKSPSDIAEKLNLAIVANDCVKDQYSQKSRQIAEKMFSKDKFVQRYSGLINSRDKTL